MQWSFNPGDAAKNDKKLKALVKSYSCQPRVNVILSRHWLYRENSIVVDPSQEGRYLYVKSVTVYCDIMGNIDILFMVLPYFKVKRLAIYAPANINDYNEFIDWINKFIRQKEMIALWDNNFNILQIDIFNQTDLGYFPEVDIDQSGECLRINDFISRNQKGVKKCRAATISVLALGRFRKQQMYSKGLNTDVLKIIANMVYGTIGTKPWVDSPK